MTAVDARESLVLLSKVQDLSDSGQHAALVEHLSDFTRADLEQSPTLALLYGSALARLGRDVEARQWVEIALERSRDRGDRVIQARALNASGGIALLGGRIDEAAGYFMNALSEGKWVGDHATVGHCSNNLGIIANMRGEHGRAVGHYTMALAAYQQANLRAGLAQSLHNLAITYRDQGDLVRALETADTAVEEAEAAGDLRLGAGTRGGRAEIRLLSGDARMAWREIEWVLQTERSLGNVVGEAEDLRVLAGTMAALNRIAEAERLFRDVIGRAEQHHRPLLAAQAERDLARLLDQAGRAVEAKELARKARVRFERIGVEAEVKKLDQFLGEQPRTEPHLQMPLESLPSRTLHPPM